jgi:hypothetical protein
MSTNSLTTTTGTHLVDRNLDPFEQFANSIAQTGTPLKFTKGRWHRGYSADEKPADGMTLIADLQGLMVGWRKWQRVDTVMRIVGSEVGYVADGYKAPSRNDLDDLDDSKWDRGLQGIGTPKDPWSFGFYLALFDPKDEEGYVYSAISNGGRRAVADLVKAFTRQRKKDPANCVPVVKLEAGFYKHREHGRIETPVLTIVDWRASDGVAAIPAPDGSDDADMGDTIPF